MREVPFVSLQKCIGLDFCSISILKLILLDSINSSLSLRCLLPIRSGISSCRDRSIQHKYADNAAWH